MGRSMLSRAIENVRFRGTAIFLQNFAKLFVHLSVVIGQFRCSLSTDSLKVYCSIFYNSTGTD